MIAPEDNASEPPPSPLAPGRWVYLYPNNGWAPLEPGVTAVRLAALGVRGVIAHSTTKHALDWLTTERVRAFNVVGLKVAAGIGLWWPDGGAAAYAAAIVEGVARCRAGELAAVVPDAESILEKKEGAGTEIADRVLAAAPDAATYCADAPPWWCPIDRRDGAGHLHPSHPSYPSRATGRFVSARYAQCYDTRKPRIPDGVVGGYLAWSRSPTQYPALGHWTLGGTFQMYRRSVNDHLAVMLPEAVSLHWNWAERDPSAEFAFAVAAALERHAFAGAGAVRSFQQQASLTVDGDVGPLTSRALGLVPSAGVVWRNR